MQVIDFKRESTRIKATKDTKVVTLEVFKGEGDSEYSYRITKGKHFEEKLAGYCVGRILQDILDYVASPEEIHEAMDTIMARLGYIDSEDDL